MRRRDFLGVLGVAGAGWPRHACAQQPMPVIGYLHIATPASTAQNLVAFRKALSEAGYVEGQNVAIEYRYAEGQFDRLSALAKDLVERRVNVIVAAGGSTVAVKAATTTIPIVGMTGGDPIRSGFVQSLNRPGGNITGIALFTANLGAKRFELLREAVPGVKLMAVLHNPSQLDSETKVDLAEVEVAARTLGQQIIVVAADNDSEFEAAFATMSREGAGALLVMASPFLVSRGAQLVALAARYALPAIHESRDVTMAGGLMSYGIDFLDAYRQLGIYTAKLLKGANPAELPMQQLVKIEFVINLKTAKTLGISSRCRCSAARTR
jgi:putative ABC transport system substrate-binding protein